MTDYSLWELILNGNKVLKRTVGETEQEYKPTNAEEKQYRRNEMKARGTLLMALLNKDQLNQPNSPQLAREDLEQIDPDDLEEMDLQWEIAMLTLELGDSSRGQAGKCQAPRNQENRGRENSRRTVTLETPTENALVAQYGIRGYDWSYQAKEDHLTNFALMAYTSLGSSSNSDSESSLYDFLKTVLGYNAASPAVKSFVNSSKILENQENNKSRSDKGYHAVPPPYTGNFIPFKHDLTFMDEIVKSENMDVITIVTPSNGKKVESNHEFADVKNNGDAVEPKTVKKNSFRPPVIED
ncbi:hypothetical protein Tco_0945559 [Tanacetum coccineum]